MRTNATIKKEWKNKISFSENYQIVIFMMHVDDTLSLTVALDLDGESMYDYEGIMDLEGTDEPNSEMKKKFKSTFNYFNKYFDNVIAKEEVILV